MLYGTLLRPKLEYVVLLWSPYQIGLREKLEQSQKTATKLVRYIKHKSYEERLSTLIYDDIKQTRQRWYDHDIQHSKSQGWNGCTIYENEYRKQNKGTYQETQNKPI